MADDYHMLEELGSGSFGVVYKAVEKATGDLVAIKHVCLPPHPYAKDLSTNAIATDRSRRQRRRHSRNPTRDRALEHMFQRTRYKIQGQLRARRQTMDRYGIPWWRLVSGPGMSTSSSDT